MTLAGRLHGSLRSVLVHGVVLGVALAASGAAPWVAPAHASAREDGSACAHVDHEFRPTTLAVDGLVEPTRVLALGQDRHGVPKPPPLTERGKWQFAWDKAVGVSPGGSSGVVRLTAHTYPRAGSRPPALGNLLLDRLRVGAVLEVSGASGERLCYRVTRRQQVRASGSLSGYYDTTGPSRLAILVCSGVRRGPGDWSHRTIWYAEPARPGSEGA
ncbi:class F sortase [Nocardioides sp. SYSU D00065]|uniref:class F sortase n=1 Tax=Nocardioides sp. SYSU D00065 TaxID=2817378 RepID=UPI001B33D296|nr:class F sortase [Nocardioides sp. SYSU D00065]